MSEQRLIDGNVAAQKLDDLSELLRTRAERDDGGFLAVEAGVGLAAGEIDDMPAIDAVQVVRCGECALSRAGGYDGAPDLSGMPGEVWCDHWDTVCGKAFYCAAGRWKEASHD